MKRLWQEERGETWFEKAMWLGFVVVVSAGAVATLGAWLMGLFDRGVQLFGH